MVLQLINIKANVYKANVYIADIILFISSIYVFLESRQAYNIRNLKNLVKIFLVLKIDVKNLIIIFCSD